MRFFRARGYFNDVINHIVGHKIFVPCPTEIDEGEAVMTEYFVGYFNSIRRIDN